MDYVRPLEAVIPGARGRVLGVLARTELELTMRTVASLAGVSQNRANQVLNELIDLGLVRRREAGSAALVVLDRENEAARAVQALADLREGVLSRLRADAATLDPPPVSLIVFGSFAKGLARTDSDIDVLAVSPVMTDADEERWYDEVGRWAERASRIAGNPVNWIVATAQEMPALLRRRGSVWDNIARDGIVLMGAAPSDLRGAA